MRYIIETTKTDAGTRVLPITEDVAQMFQAIIEDRNAPKVEEAIDGYSGFLSMSGIDLNSYKEGQMKRRFDIDQVFQSSFIRPHQLHPPSHGHGSSVQVQPSFVSIPVKNNGPQCFS